MSRSISIAHGAGASPRKLDALTSLRFFAALAIVVEHSKDAFVATSWIGPLPFDYGVSFFFALSGFILTYVYRSMDEPGAVREFLVARVARIWPLHIVTLALVLIMIPSVAWIPGGLGQQAGLIALANIFLVQSWLPIPAYFFSFNAVAWSISTEIFFYLLFPLLRRQWASTWHWKSVLVIAGAGTVLTLATWAGVTNADIADRYALSSVGFGYISPFTRVLEFLMGMWAGAIFLGCENRALGNRFVWTAVEIAAIASVFLSRDATAGLPDRVAGHPLGATAWPIFVGHCGASLGFAAIIIAFAFERGFLSRSLRWRPLVMLGEASFAFYLVHQLIMTFYYVNIPRFQAVPNNVLFAGYWFVTVVAAFVLWAVVEKPMRSRIRRWFAGNAPAELATVKGGTTAEI